MLQYYAQNQTTSPQYLAPLTPGLIRTEAAPMQLSGRNQYLFLVSSHSHIFCREHCAAVLSLTNEQKEQFHNLDAAPHIPIAVSHTFNL